jgi:hypothetical protein
MVAGCDKLMGDFGFWIKVFDDVNDALAAHDLDGRAWSV